jgi:hypothetical protein
MKVINISAKCSDLFSASLYDNGKHVGDYEGYVPEFFPGRHYGDYVMMEIDAETGKITNWHKPTAAQLAETFKP